MRSWATALTVIAVVATAAAAGAQAQTKPLPPGHPPVSPGPPPTSPGPAPAPANRPPAGKPLMWTAPATWVAESPKSAMRRAQYRIPGKGGDAECVVFYFGPGDGGSAKDNANRWIGQFVRADGQPVTDGKTRTKKVGDIPVTMVEVAGTYVGGMGGRPGPEQPNQMLLGAIAEGPDANWFFRATGPRATIEAARADFDKMIQSVKRAP